MSTIAQNINVLISFAGGICCTCLAYRGVPAGAAKTTEWEQWHARYGLMLKILGPFLILTGLLQGAFKLAM